MPGRRCRTPPPRRPTNRSRDRSCCTRARRSHQAGAAARGATAAVVRERRPRGRQDREPQARIVRGPARSTRSRSPTPVPGPPRPRRSPTPSRPPRRRVGAPVQRLLSRPQAADVQARIDRAGPPSHDHPDRARRSPRTLRNTASVTTPTPLASGSRRCDGSQHDHARSAQPDRAARQHQHPEDPARRNGHLHAESPKPQPMAASQREDL